MAWNSELQALASRNPFVDSLLKGGYDVAFINGHLVIFGVPYLNAGGELCHMDVISSLDLRQEHLIDAPSDHKVYFAGDRPCSIDGSPIAAGYAPEARMVSDAISGTHMLSSKPSGMRAYVSIEEKITQYLDLITSPAVHKYNATPRRALVKHREDAPSPLRFPDTLSARDGVVELSHRLRGVKVAIVGCGGTGAYVLDFIAKTHVQEIHLFDDDVVHVHTLFRLPGMFGEQHLGMAKVDALYQAYAAFHAAITPHVARVDAANLDDLAAFDFVFICVDDGPSRFAIAQFCHDALIAFVDVGMGLNKDEGGLYGFIRMAGGEDGDFDRLKGTPYLPAENAHDREYRAQPQLAELNALNAAMAVVRFKQRMRVYGRMTESAAVVFDIAAIQLDAAP
jgi:hypothetical protein